MSVLGIATRVEMDADLASAVLPIGVQLNAIQAAQKTNQTAVMAAIAALASQVSALQRSLDTMSASISTALDRIATDLAAIKADVDSFAAALAAAGVDPALVTRANDIADSMDALKTSADAAVGNVVVAPPTP